MIKLQERDMNNLINIEAFKVKNTQIYYVMLLIKQVLRQLNVKIH